METRRFFETYRRVSIYRLAHGDMVFCFLIFAAISFCPVIRYILKMAAVQLEWISFSDPVVFMKNIWYAIDLL